MLAGLQDWALTLTGSMSVDMFHKGWRRGQRRERFIQKKVKMYKHQTPDIYVLKIYSGTISGGKYEDIEGSKIQ